MNLRYVIIFVALIVLVFSKNISEIRPISCRCTRGLCPDLQTESDGYAWNHNECVSDYGYCFYKAIIEESQLIFTEAGCIGAHIMINMCGNRVQQGHSTFIQCCNTTMCNEDLLMFERKVTKDLNLLESNANNAWDFKMVLIGAVGAMCIMVLGGLLYKFCGARLLKRLGLNDDKHVLFTEIKEKGHVHDNLMPDVSLSNTSGAGRTQFVQRTISKQVQLLELVGQGRYGEVYKALWQGDLVAIKQFDPRDEHSWLQECEMYETAWLRHENILGYIASDCKDTVSVTKWWIMMEYCDHGSLHDYLQHARYTPAQLLEAVKGIFAGLEHLHTEICGKKGKPSIAHRDLKTKNILVKRPNMCCIGDLGLAVTSTDYKKTVTPNNFQVGTRRYMAPEILNGTAKIDSFTSLRAADMYSSSFIIWEMAQRVTVDNELSEYTLPYIDLVPGDPTVEDMKKVVVDCNERPPLQDRWEKHKTTAALSSIIQELWYPDPSARLSALRVKKTLGELQVHKIESFSPGCTI